MIHLYAIGVVQGEAVSGNLDGHGTKKSTKNIIFWYKMSRSHTKDLFDLNEHVISVLKTVLMCLKMRYNICLRLKWLIKV